MSVLMLMLENYKSGVRIYLHRFLYCYLRSYLKAVFIFH